MKHAVIDMEGNVINSVEITDGTDWTPPEGNMVIAHEHASVGWKYIDGVFVPPFAAPQPSANELLLSQIKMLEATVTLRRSREAILGVDNGWLKNLNDQITSLRVQLTKE